MSQSILILGANGFIGSTLVYKILKHTNWVVNCIDKADFNLTFARGADRFSFAKIDAFENPRAIEAAIEAADTVVPLIAVARPAEYVKNPIGVYRLDFELNADIVKLCAKHKKRVVFPSTSEAYGMCPDAAFDEENSNLVLGPIKNERWVYANIKQMLDRLIWAYGKHEGLQFTIFRPFNFIGPKLDAAEAAKGNSSRVITQFVYNIVDGRPLCLVNGGLQRRSFTYIGDGADCLLKILENKNGCADSGIFNIGNPSQQCSIKELAAMLIEEISAYADFASLAKSAQIVEVSGREYYGDGYQDVDNRVPSIEKAKRVLGWEPKTTLRQCVKKILDYHLLGVDDEACL